MSNIYDKMSQRFIETAQFVDMFSRRIDSLSQFSLLGNSEPLSSLQVGSEKHQFFFLMSDKNNKTLKYQVSSVGIQSTIDGISKNVF